MQLTSGARLGNCEIAAPLGAGGMGEVYRARDLRLGREVALKVLPADVAYDAGRLARFEHTRSTIRWSWCFELLTYGGTTDTTRFRGAAILGVRTKRSYADDSTSNCF